MAFSNAGLPNLSLVVVVLGEDSAPGFSGFCDPRHFGPLVNHGLFNHFQQVRSIAAMVVCLVGVGKLSGSNPLWLNQPTWSNLT